FNRIFDGETYGSVTSVNRLSRFYELKANLDMSALTFHVIGNSTQTFSGRLNGKGYQINNLVISADGVDYFGLFGRVASSAIIENLTIASSTIAGKDRVGALIGSLEGGTISKIGIGPGVSVSGAGMVGGMIGYALSTNNT